MTPPSASLPSRAAVRSLNPQAIGRGAITNEHVTLEAGPNAADDARAEARKKLVAIKDSVSKFFTAEFQVFALGKFHVVMGNQQQQATYSAYVDATKAELKRLKGKGEEIAAYDLMADFEHCLSTDETWLSTQEAGWMAKHNYSYCSSFGTGVSVRAPHPVAPAPHPAAPCNSHS